MDGFARWEVHLGLLGEASGFETLLGACGGAMDGRVMWSWLMEDCGVGVSGHLRFRECE